MSWNHRHNDCLFISLFRLTTQETSKNSITGPLWRESSCDPWISLTKGLVMQKVFPCHDVVHFTHHLFKIVLTICKNKIQYRNFGIFNPNATGGFIHWGRVTHICVNRLTIIGSDNGLSPGRHQALIWTIDGTLLITLGNKLQWNLKKKFRHFYSGKFIWKRRLDNDGHFVSTSLCLNKGSQNAPSLLCLRRHLATVWPGYIGCVTFNNTPSHYR